MTLVAYPLPAIDAVLVVRRFRLAGAAMAECSVLAGSEGVVASVTLADDLATVLACRAAEVCPQVPLLEDVAEAMRSAWRPLARPVRSTFEAREMLKRERVA